MTDLIMPRRSFITGLVGLVAAPAVVKASSLMPVKVFQFNDGIALTSAAHPEIATYSGMNLARFRELVMPGLRAVIEETYIDIPKYQNIFKRLS